MYQVYVYQEIADIVGKGHLGPYVNMGCGGVSAVTLREGQDAIVVKGHLLPCVPNWCIDVSAVTLREGQETL